MMPCQIIYFNCCVHKTIIKYFEYIFSSEGSCSTEGQRQRLYVKYFEILQKFMHKPEINLMSYEPKSFFFSFSTPCIHTIMGGESSDGFAYLDIII